MVARRGFGVTETSVGHQRTSRTQIWKESWASKQWSPSLAKMIDAKKTYLKNLDVGTPLVGQQIKIHLAIQGVQVLGQGTKISVPRSN